MEKLELRTITEKDLVIQQPITELLYEPSVPATGPCMMPDACPEEPPKTEVAPCEKPCYKEDLPYPPIEGIRKNPHCAALLKQLFSGRVSEVTAVMQYFYASCQMRCSHKEIYEALKYISIVEMEHMDLLAQMLLCMGCDTTYTYWSRGKGEIWWNGSLVDYSKTASQILIESISSEEQAIKAYEEAIGKIKDPAVTDVLRRIVLDEKCHLSVFKQLYKKLMEQQQRKRCLRA